MRLKGFPELRRAAPAPFRLGSQGGAGQREQPRSTRTSPTISCRGGDRGAAAGHRDPRGAERAAERKRAPRGGPNPPSSPTSSTSASTWTPSRARPPLVPRALLHPAKHRFPGPGVVLPSLRAPLDAEAEEVASGLWREINRGEPAREHPPHPRAGAPRAPQGAGPFGRGGAAPQDLRPGDARARLVRQSPAMPPQFIFTMKDLRKVTRRRQGILKGIWLSFYPDAKIGILGPNGAGKSTLPPDHAGLDKDFAGEAFPADGRASATCPRSRSWTRRRPCSSTSRSRWPPSASSWTASRSSP